MPFGNMSDDDLDAIISYLRAQPAVRNEVPRNKWGLVGKVVKSFFPTFKPRTAISPPPTAPVENVTRERGEYLARFVTNCVGCHTPRDPVTFAATGPEFSGGFEMGPGLLSGADSTIWFKTPNLTPREGSALLANSRIATRSSHASNAAAASILAPRCPGSVCAHEHRRSRCAV